MMKAARAIWGLLLLIWLAPTPGGTSAQSAHHESATVKTIPTRTDSIKLGTHAKLLLNENPVDSAALRRATDSTRLDKKPLAKTAKPTFVPNPKRALWLSLVFPGAGQIYNRKYWKLPFIYGGFLGCTYALMWNQQMYTDYSQAYLDITDSNPATKSYEQILPPGYDISGKEERFATIFKNKKNFYRRYRDLSAFCFIGVYLLSVVDAYVDAQLSVFDISRDLSMKVEPAVINTNTLGRRTMAMGLGCSLNF